MSFEHNPTLYFLEHPQEESVLVISKICIKMDQVGDLATKCPTDKRPHQSGDRLHCATHTLPYSPSATPLGCRLRSLCFRSNTLAILNGCPSQWYWRHVISLQGSSAGACFARVGSALLSFRRISQISRKS